MRPLPQHMIDRLMKLPKSKRRLVAQELIGGYEMKASELHEIAERMAVTWVHNQACYFEEIIESLRVYVDD